MVEEITKQAVGQGLWAVLFVYILFRQLKANEDRETKYEQMITSQLSTNAIRESKYEEIINNLSKNLQCLPEIQRDIQDIKTKFDRGE